MIDCQIMMNEVLSSDWITILIKMGVDHWWLTRVRRARATFCRQCLGKTSNSVSFRQLYHIQVLSANAWVEVQCSWFDIWDMTMVKELGIRIGCWIGAAHYQPFTRRFSSRAQSIITVLHQIVWRQFVALDKIVSFYFTSPFAFIIFANHFYLNHRL